MKKIRKIRILDQCLYLVTFSSPLSEHVTVNEEQENMNEYSVWPYCDHSRVDGQADAVSHRNAVHLLRVH